MDAYGALSPGQSVPAPGQNPGSLTNSDFKEGDLEIFVRLWCTLARSQSAQPPSQSPGSLASSDLKGGALKCGRPMPMVHPPLAKEWTATRSKSWLFNTLRFQLFTVAKMAGGGSDVIFAHAQYKSGRRTDRVVTGIF